MNATPASTKKAKATMADARDFIRTLIGQLHEDGILDSHPEIAALADEAKTHTDALRTAMLTL